ncbi:hypothetical protein N483_16285 [Pseudoalteromonas luteoviolacea NCIMB 1944]|uniref:Uncharacterized protein n=1 Tax=Pseudoalteromonas luteoviolacea (strain 2ta16) TaxID=1353533 RepID=V4I0G1_PSEL2|nr:hypothetical protein PL2TA16_02918 [Pseudoalteromonas luteoviolacea 2ta16]KZN41169.1 hypothetical protein N483_16285 [Pseudoalteromonas luteoviolacea NCIMB 1944]
MHPKFTTMRFIEDFTGNLRENSGLVDFSMGTGAILIKTISKPDYLKGLYTTLKKFLTLTQLREGALSMSLVSEY